MATYCSIPSCCNYWPCEDHWFDLTNKHLANTISKFQFQTYILGKQVIFPLTTSERNQLVSKATTLLTNARFLQDAPTKVQDRFFQTTLRQLLHVDSHIALNYFLRPTSALLQRSSSQQQKTDLLHAIMDIDWETTSEGFNPIACWNELLSNVYHHVHFDLYVSFIRLFYMLFPSCSVGELFVKFRFCVPDARRSAVRLKSYVVQGASKVVKNVRICAQIEDARKAAKLVLFVKNNLSLVKRYLKVPTFECGSLSEFKFFVKLFAFGFQELLYVGPWYRVIMTKCTCNCIVKTQKCKSHRRIKQVYSKLKAARDWRERFLFISIFLQNDTDCGTNIETRFPLSALAQYPLVEKPRAQCIMQTVPLLPASSSSEMRTIVPLAR